MRPGRVLVLLAALGAVPACGGAPRGGGALPAAPLDDARRAVAEAPRDVAAWRALAAQEDAAGNLGAALAAYDAVLALGGPLGPRLDGTGHARRRELLAMRAAVRLRVGDPAALGDLEASGGNPRPGERVRALADLRHAADDVRAAGRARLATSGDDVLARATGPAPTPASLLALADWAWTGGARRAAWEAYDAWRHTGVAATNDELARVAAAERWWRADDGSAAAPPRLAADAVALTLRRLVRGEVPGWFAALAPLVGDAPPEVAPAWARVTLWRLRGDAAAARAALDEALVAGPPSDDARLVLAAEVSLAGLPTTVSEALLAPLAADPDAARLAARVRRGNVLTRRADPDAVAAAYAARRAGRDELADGLRALARVARTTPARLDRAVEAYLARDVDVTSASAGAAALFDALADPARARALWQRAADASNTVASLLGLGTAAARGGDPDAAMVFLSAGIAASGDPGAAAILPARTLIDAGAALHALELLRMALELVGPDELPAVVALAAEASRAVGRAAQANELEAAWAHRLAPAVPGDPTDPRAVVGADATAVASYWHPADEAGVRARVALLATGDDPRAHQARAELATLATAADTLLAWLATRALVAEAR